MKHAREETAEAVVGVEEADAAAAGAAEDIKFLKIFFHPKMPHTFAAFLLYSSFVYNCCDLHHPPGYLFVVTHSFFYLNLITK